jgi:hypothetical protein
MVGDQNYVGGLQQAAIIETIEQTSNGSIDTTNRRHRLSRQRAVRSLAAGGPAG